MALLSHVSCRFTISDFIYMIIEALAIDNINNNNNNKIAISVWKKKRMLIQSHLFKLLLILILPLFE